MRSIQNGAATVLLVALAMALSGCTGAAAAGTAAAGEDTANSTAENDFASDAALVAIVGVEGAGWDDWDETPWDGGGQTGQKVNECFQKAADAGEVGDGVAELWAYAYVADSKPGMAHLVFVSKAGDVICSESIEAHDADFDDFLPITKWEVNSDEAVEAALAESESLRNGLSSENYALMQALIHPKSDGENQPFSFEDPIWFIAGGGGDSSGGSGGFAMVNAMSGEVMFTSDDFGAFF